MPDTCILIYGRIKSWQECYTSFITALSNYDYDIFCSLNSEYGEKEAIDFSKNKNVKEVVCSPTPYPDILYAIQKKVILEHREKIFSANYHKYLCFKRSLEHKIYDRYIFFRADILTEEKIPFIIPNKLTLHCPKLYRYGMRDNPKPFDEEILNDQVMVCDKDVASVIADTYTSIFDLYSRGVMFHPETLLMNQCLDYGIGFEYFDFNYKLNPNRQL